MQNERNMEDPCHIGLHISKDDLEGSLTEMLQALTVPGACIPFEQRTVSGKLQAPIVRRVTASSTGKDGVKLEYTPWLVVGLGNPGNKYHGTRHNVGFEMVDHILKEEGIVMNAIQSKALIGIGSVGEVPVLLAKPQTYMNFSGESVYDEMSLPNGVMRLQPKGGHGHHNGMKSIMEHLDGCRQFPRLCIGIGNPPGAMDVKAFLLQKFSAEEREQVDEAIKQGVAAVRTLILRGFGDSIDKFNLVQRYKYHKV